NHIVDWTGAIPDAIKIQIKQEANGGGPPLINTVYDPGTDVKVYLQAPPGSQGAVVRKYFITYDPPPPVTGPDDPLGKPSESNLPPTVIPAAQDNAYGSKVPIKITGVGGKAITSIVTANAIPRITAKITFADEQGNIIKDHNNSDLEA